MGTKMGQVWIARTTPLLLEVDPGYRRGQMSDLYWNTIAPDMRLVMNGFGKSEIGSHFYLAGGTALALQIGHRTSVDLDFFSPDLDIPTVRETLQDSLHEFSPELADSSWGNLVFVARTVRVGFY